MSTVNLHLLSDERKKKDEGKSTVNKIKDYALKKIPRDLMCLKRKYFEKNISNLWARLHVSYT